MSAVGIIGIVVALAIFLYGAYKNVSTLYLAPIAGVIVAVTNGINAAEAFTAIHIGGVTGMMISVFPTIFLGAIFGKVLTDCGAAGAIAGALTNKLILSAEGQEKQAKRAVLALLLIGCIFAFGGVDGFVAIFATFPIAMIMAEKIGIPRRYVPAMLVTCCGANSAPFVLSINNIMCMGILGTGAGAAPIPGFVAFLIIEVGNYFICSKIILSAMRKGESFERGNCPNFSAMADTKERPSVIVALLPLIAVFVLFIATPIVIKNVVADPEAAAALSNMVPASLALVSGILLAIILMNKYFPKNGEETGLGAWCAKVVNSLNEGAVSGAQSLMIICAAAGFAAVVQSTAVFGGFVEKVMGLNFPPMVLALILIIVIVAFTSSPPAALQVALPIIASAYIWPQLASGAAPLIDPNALARVSAFAVSTFETLPVNGLILLTTGLAQVKIKEAYFPMFLETCIMTLVGAIVCLVILTLAPGLA